jgi:hypothetical protein
MAVSQSPPQAGQAGIEPATYGFGDRCSAKLSYWPVSVLLCLAMCRVPATARTEFVQLKTTRIVAPILLGRVVVFLAFGARKGNHHSDCSLRHYVTTSTDTQSPRWELNPWPHPYQGCALPTELRGPAPDRTLQPAARSESNFTSFRQCVKSVGLVEVCRHG